MPLTASLAQLGEDAQRASYVLATAPTAQKNEALTRLADTLEAQAAAILAANRLDVEAAEARGMSAALLDRLTLTDARVQALAADTRQVAALPDPVGTLLDDRVLPNGLRLQKRRVALGVLGVIYEARPNVTIDVAALGLKAGSAVLLRGSADTLHTNRVLVTGLRTALEQAGLPAGAVQFIDDPDRALVTQLLRLDRYVDLIIPRGGAKLHQLCKEQSLIPVITGGIGICHMFVDASANLEQAVDLIENAKVQRPSVCNALDTALLHEAIAPTLLPALAARLAPQGVTFKADPASLQLLAQAGHDADAASLYDYDQEWLSLTLGLRVVDSLDQAIDHIRQHSTQHSDSILTRSDAHAERFVREVDSAAVYVNASTRFTDGSQFGLGAEVAVSTQKLHARGPMGLEELTTYKWVGLGDGHVRG
ncbi:MAG: glutamate-5-semialdehyde dehydrogenase [Bacteroidota bacterium]